MGALDWLAAGLGDTERNCPHSANCPSGVARCDTAYYNPNCGQKGNGPPGKSHCLGIVVCSSPGSCGSWEGKCLDGRVHAVLCQASATEQYISTAVVLLPAVCRGVPARWLASALAGIGRPARAGDCHVRSH